MADALAAEPQALASRPWALIGARQGDAAGKDAVWRLFGASESRGAAARARRTPRA